MKKFCFLKVLVVVLLCMIYSHAHAEKKPLAILNLKATNIDAMGYNGEILHALISSIESDKNIDLMTRREIEEILYKTGIVQDNTHESVLTAGNALGINFVLFGDVTKKGNEIVAKLGLMDIQNKVLVKNWELVFRDHDSILNEVPEFSRELSNILSNYMSGAGAASTESQDSTNIEYLNAKTEGNAIRISWKLRTHNDSLSYNVYRAESKDGPYQFLGKTTESFFQDSTVKNGLSYFYRIGIISGTGPEVKSSYTALFITRPRPPLVMSGKGYVKRVEIKFVPSLINEQDKFKIVKYKIYRQKSPGDWQHIGVTDSENISQFDIDFTFFDESDLKDGTTYTYALSSLDDKNSESPLSDPVTAETIRNPVLSLEKDDLLRKVILSWKPVDNISGYYLYRKTENTGWKKVASISGASKTTITDEKELSDGQQYLYYLTAYDNKKETGPSNEVRTKTKNLPDFPANLQAQDGLVKSVRISWTPVEDPDIGGYNIYRGTDNNMKRIATVREYKSSSYLDKGEAFALLEDGRNYFYAIASFNLFDAEGKQTKYVQASTKPRPSAVKGLSASAGSDHIFIGWERNPETDIKLNVLYRNISGGSTFSTLSEGSWSKLTELSVDQTSFKDFDLKPELNYIYRIISEDKDGLKSDPADSNKVLSPIVKQEK
ncbi:MAG: hypothetical protein R6V76_08380 [Desulfobacterales bacterium]